MSWTSATATAEPHDAAAPEAGGSWPAARSPIIDWLIGDTHLLPSEAVREGHAPQELIAAASRCSQEVQP